MASPITVLKFGGTSVQDASAIHRLFEIVKSRAGQRLVVVSALAKVTDQLIKMGNFCEEGKADLASELAQTLHDRHLEVAKALGISQVSFIDDLFLHVQTLVRGLATIREVSPRSRDQLNSVGELASSFLVNEYLKLKGLDSVWSDSRTMITTNSEYTSASVNFDVTNQKIKMALTPLLERNVVVTQGFIGSDIKGITTTLGRGGSDYSAAVYGAALSANKVEIWTDVDGILSTDPRLVPQASIIQRIHFLEAAEMAIFGAKVLHPGTIFPAIKQKIPVWILNSKNPSQPGTEITFDDSLKSSNICGIAFKKGITVVNIYSTRMLGAHGFLKTVFDVFARYKLSVDLIATSEVNISLTLDPNFSSEALENARRELSEFSDVEINSERAMIAVIGGGIRKTPGLASQIFSEIADVNIQLISMGASELNISFVVSNEECQKVVQKLHSRLIK